MTADSAFSRNEVVMTKKCCSKYIASCILGTSQPMFVDQDVDEMQHLHIYVGTNKIVWHKK